MLRPTRPFDLPRYLLVLVALGLGLPALTQQPDVRIIQPRHLSTVIGASTIELRVTVPSGATIERIDVLVDRRAIGSLSAPPWRMAWDAGDATRGHTIEAVLVLADGRQDRAVVRTSALRINQVEEVDLVNLYAIVVDRAGQYVTDLDKRDFSVFENGRREAIERFSAERKPLHVAIVLDTSTTMGRNSGAKLRAAKEAALEFLDVLGSQDVGMVVTFDDRVVVAQDLTPSRAQLATAIRAAEPKGGTALYDAVWRTAHRLGEYDGRRVMVLLSDGRDESYEGMEPGSLHTREEALEQAMRSEVMVFAIGLGKNLEHEFAIHFGSFYGKSNVNVDLSVASILRDFADSTGGRALMSPGGGKLRKAFRDVAEDLRNQYSLAYVSDDPERDGAWREIRVEAGRDGLEVITRKGYYAPGPGDDILDRSTR